MPAMIGALVSSSCPPDTVPWPNEPCESVKTATAAANDFLRTNMFAFDQPNAPALFDDGIVVPTISLGLLSRQKFGWAARVPRDIFNEFVLPYANVDEARNDWRQFMWDMLSDAAWVKGLSNDTDLQSVALELNSQLWKTLGAVTNKSAVVFKSEQTPLIYDPMSTILFGYASCTGISITYVDALRTLGIPARLAGTPAWHGKYADGNHNWLEIWLGEGEGEGWHFIEGAPAGAGETLSNPCDKWFCNPEHMRWSDGIGTEVFAALYQAQTRSSTYYPMAWDLANHDVAGENRTAYYVEACGKC